MKRQSYIIKKNWHNVRRERERGGRESKNERRPSTIPKKTVFTSQRTEKVTFVRFEAIFLLI